MLLHRSHSGALMIARWQIVHAAVVGLGGGGGVGGGGGGGGIGDQKWRKLKLN